MQTIDVKNFGPNAYYEISPSKKPQTQPVKSHEWNAVIKGVDPEISEEDFASELEEHNINFTKIIRILAPTGERTHLIRIFFNDKETAEEAIFQGIKILGRRYRVEAPREQARHIPCRNCSQYGHIRFNCNNPSTCFKCGKNPNICLHKPQDKTSPYCATCFQNDHYTGQVKCPKYPRNLSPPLIHKYTPLINQTHTQSPPKPSSLDFPALTPAWQTHTPSPAQNDDQEITDPNHTPEESTTHTNLTNQLDHAFQIFQKNLMKIIEDYVDKKIEKLQDDLIKYTTTLIDNTVQPKDRRALQTISNSTAKKLWNKQVKIMPVNNTIDIMINKMTDNLSTITKNIAQHLQNDNTSNGPDITVPTPSISTITL